MTRSHSTPNVDPNGGDQLAAERFLYWLLGGWLLLTIVLVIAGRIW